METKVCKNCQQQFIIELDDFTFYKKIDVPPPTLCPECRFQRRLLFRNERSFYKRSCGLCQKNIITVYSPDYPAPVYCQKCWWGDGWDPLSYGCEYDFSRSFLDQYRELYLSVPMLSLQNDDGIASTNCEYNSDFAFSKNCYMCSCGWYNENCLYQTNANYNKDVADSFTVHHSELSYECVTCDGCYGCSYATRCFDCRGVFFGYDLRGCSDCTMCVGLRSKSYCILNQQYSREEYFAKIKELRLNTREGIEKCKKEFNEFSLQFPRRFAHILKSVNSTGDMLLNCKNSKDCFFFNDLENCKFMVMNDGAKDCYDCNNTGKPVLCYESATPDNSYGNIATIFCWKCNKAEYSNNCHSSSNVLGCNALKSTEYAILNKKYSKDEFIALREKIIEHMRSTGEWGEFFPASVSPHAYNETSAYDWFRLDEADAIAKGYSWKKSEGRNYVITITADAIPQTIESVTDAITTDIIECAHKGLCHEKCSTAFRITQLELQFYRKTKLPIPNLCPNCRFYQRYDRILPTKLWHRRCMKEGCANEFETNFAPIRPEIVYCEQCYQATVL